jgi:hypothetical protein
LEKIKVAKMRMQRIEAIVTGEIPKKDILFTISPNTTDQRPLKHIMGELMHFSFLFVASTPNYQK